MVKRTGTSIRKTRSLKRKNIRWKGKLALTKYLQNFQNGDKVVLIYEPSVQEGLYHHRYYGKQGTVIGKQGNCYIVKVKNENTTKKIIVHPVHLKRL